MQLFPSKISSPNTTFIPYLGHRLSEIPQTFTKGVERINEQLLRNIRGCQVPEKSPLVVRGRVNKRKATGQALEAVRYQKKKAQKNKIPLHHYLWLYVGGLISNMYFLFTNMENTVLKGTVSSIFSNALKNQKSHLHQCQPENNGSVLFTILVH